MIDFDQGSYGDVDGAGGCGHGFLGMLVVFIAIAGTFIYMAIT